MKRKEYMDILIFAKAYLKSIIENHEILIDALGIDPEEKDAADKKVYGITVMQKKKETLVVIENELEKLTHGPKQWFTVGAENFGRVHICPYCNEKSPEKFHYCPNCGEEIWKGV